MKVLVAIKRVVDFNFKIRVKADGSGVDINNAKMSINPFDEIAVEEALLLKEQGIASEVVVVSIGPSACQETIRHALALGADRGIHVEIPESPETLCVAKILKAVVTKEDPRLVLLGKQAIDNDCNQVAQMLSALLGWPQSTFVSKISLEGNICTTIREVDGGLETLSLPIPCIISTDLRLNTPRYPTLPNIMKAKQKPLQQVALSELGVEVQNHTKTLSVREPSVRKAGVILSSVEDLIPILKKVMP